MKRMAAEAANTYDLFCYTRYSIINKTHWRDETKPFPCSLRVDVIRYKDLINGWGLGPHQHAWFCVLILPAASSSMYNVLSCYVATSSLTTTTLCMNTTHIFLDSCLDFEPSSSGDDNGKDKIQLWFTMVPSWQAGLSQYEQSSLVPNAVESALCPFCGRGLGVYSK